MFWGLVLEPYKKYTQKVDQSFHISQAALDLSSCNNQSDTIQLVVEYESSNFILATLSKKTNVYQVPLDLIFKTGDQISFKVIGNGKVHLSGYHVLEDLDTIGMNGEDESELDEFEIDNDKRKRRKTVSKSKGGKKAKVDDSIEEDSDDLVFDEDESSEDDEEEQTIVKKKASNKKKKDGSFFSMDDEDEDDDDDDEDDDGDDEEDGEEEEDDDEEGEEDEDEELDDEEEDDTDENESFEEQKTPKSGKKKKAQTPNGLPTSTKGNKSEQKLNQSVKDSIPGTPGKTPKSEVKGKNVKNSDREATPKGKKNDLSKGEDKTPKSPKSEGSPQKKVLEGGVISEELKIGNGPVAKPGKMANVYYVGVLSSTKKQFDSVQNGPGFKFRIGRNEVIKGWDIGLNGMKVGGKRRLTIPPHLAYGAKGSPPVIPPNATLVFTVELKGLS